MKLESEIHQKSFKSPQHKLAINLLFTSNWLNSKYEHFFKGLDLTHHQYNVLRILRGQNPKPCSLKYIKERMLDKMSDTSRVLDKLVLKGYATREVSPQDRRSINACISEKGLAILKQLDFIDEMTEDIFKNLPKSKIKQLNELLDQLRG
ncbi:MAG: MarR family winged helix-turn-helix transcriptional regulator [Bacteroidota bacterium]|jgi:DNA-binding MarR family transcriptional regulator